MSRIFLNSVSVRVTGYAIIPKNGIYYHLQCFRLYKTKGQDEQPCVKSQNVKNVDEKKTSERIGCPYRRLMGMNHGNRIHHLLFVVHGARQGAINKDKYNNFSVDIEAFKDTVRDSTEGLEVLCECDECKCISPEGIYYSLPQNGGIEIIPVFWRKVMEQRERNVENLSAALLPQGYSSKKKEFYAHKTLLKDTQLKTLPKLFNVASEIASEVISYCFDSNKDLFLKVLADELNRLYSNFILENPNANPTVSICAHSLGCPITFDLLCEQWDGTYGHALSSPTNRLLFNVENLILIGSPLSLYLITKNLKLTVSYPPNTPNSFFPKTKYIYNIFHPLDPVSHKLEPLLEYNTPKIPPHNIDYDITKNIVPSKNSNNITPEDNTYYFNSNMYISIISAITKYCYDKIDFNIPAQSIPFNDVTYRCFQYPTFRSNVLHETPIADNSANSSNPPKKLDTPYSPLSNSNISHPFIKHVERINPLGRLDFALKHEPSKFQNMLISSYLSAFTHHSCYWRDPLYCFFVVQQLYKRTLRKIIAK